MDGFGWADQCSVAALSTCHDLVLLALNCSLQLADPSRPEVYAVHLTCSLKTSITRCDEAAHAQPAYNAPQATEQEIRASLLISNAPSRNVWAFEQCCCPGASHGRTSAAPLLQVVGWARLTSAGLIGGLCSMQPAVGSVPLPEQLIHRLQPVCRHLSVPRRLRD